MHDQVVCPHCKRTIPITDALSHEIKVKLNKEAAEWKSKKEAEFKERLVIEQKKYDEERANLEKELILKAQKKAEDAISHKIKDAENEALELKTNNKLLQEQQLELNKTLRQLKQDNEQKQLEMEKRLNEAQDRIREEEQKKLAEQYHFKMLEKDKQLEDARRANEDLKRKLEQGSQQTQGEVLELEIENLLRSEFPHDEVRAVAKGIRGGDIIQIVRNPNGKICGTIMWETKRTKTWSNDWIPKLKDDQRSLKAELAVIITEMLPGELKTFGLKDGVWVGNFSCVLGLSHALRRNLLELSILKSSMDGKSEKMEVLYNYIYGTEFRQRVEAIIEAFTNLQGNIEKEKRWFAQKWSKEELDIRRVLDNMFGLQGDIKSITGQELEQIDAPHLIQETVEVKITTDTLFDKK